MTALLRHPGCRAAWTSCAGRGGGSLAAHRARGTPGRGPLPWPSRGGRSREGDRVPWDGVSRSRRIPGLPRPSVLPALGRFPRGVSWKFPVQGGGGCLSEDYSNSAGVRGPQPGGAQGSGSAVRWWEWGAFRLYLNPLYCEWCPLPHPQAWLVRKAASLLSSFQIENAPGLQITEKSLFLT